MYRNLRWKLVVILALVIGTSAFAWVPPLANRLGLPLPGFMAERRLSLGLDLKGGVQFVLRVNAQEALGVDASLGRGSPSLGWPYEMILRPPGPITPTTMPTPFPWASTRSTSIFRISEYHRQTAEGAHPSCWSPELREGRSPNPQRPPRHTRSSSLSASHTSFVACRQ
jgi:hypothetical protein